MAAAPLVAALVWMRVRRARSAKKEASAQAEQLESYTVPREFNGRFKDGELFTLKRVFRMLDPNGDGAISKSELAKVLPQLNDTMTADEVQAAVDECFAVADEDSSGEINFVEFLLYMEHARRTGRTSVFSTLADKIEANITKTEGQTVIYVLLFFSFLVLVNTSTELFHFFKCDQFPEADGGAQSYLLKDYSLSCDSTRYKIYQAYVILMIG